MTIRARILPRLPVRVIPGPGIDASVSHGNLDVGLEYRGLIELPADDADLIAAQDPVTGAFKKVPLGGLPIPDDVQDALDLKADKATQIATQHSLTGGGDLSADRTLSLVNDASAPGADRFYGTDAGGNKGWITGASKVDVTRQVATQHSLQGGGNLSANRTLSLVGDTASPGNLKLYGTDGAGARGWYDIPITSGVEISLLATSIATTTIPGTISTIRTIGYSVVGDRGKGAIYKKAVSEPTHPGKAQSLDGQWWELTNTVITPEMWGAVGAGGMTSDQTPWNNLIAYATARTKCLAICEGDYYCPSGLNLPGDFGIEGYRIGRVRSDGTTYSAIRADHVNNITIHGLRVDIPRTVLRIVNAYSMYFLVCDNVLIEDCHTDGGGGIWTYRSNYVDVVRTRVVYSKADSVHFAGGSTYCRAIDCTSEDAGDDSFSCTATDATFPPKNIEYRGCRSYRSKWGAAFAAYSCRGLVISDCAAENQAGPLLKLADYASGGACGDVTISNIRASSITVPATVPNNYWYGDPLPDPANTFTDTYAAIVIASARRVQLSCFEIYSVSNAASPGNAFGVLIGDALYIALGGEIVIRSINGSAVGVRTMLSGSPGYITINGLNATDISAAGIHVEKALSASMVVTGCSFQTGSDCAYIANAGAAKVVVSGNVNMGGSGGFTDGGGNGALTISGNF